MTLRTMVAENVSGELIVDRIERLVEDLVDEIHEELIRRLTEELTEVPKDAQV